MNIGLFFGSFNPVHLGHLIISQYFLNNTKIDQVWFVVSPHNPLKDKKILINQNIRLQLVQEAIKNNSGFRISEIEYDLPQPSYTIDTVTELKKQYPNFKFILLLGTDSLESINKWKDYNRLITENDIYLYPRTDHLNYNWISTYDKIKLFHAPLIEISATYIRNQILENKSIQYLVPENVYKYFSLKGEI